MSIEIRERLALVVRAFDQSVARQEIVKSSIKTNLESLAELKSNHERYLLLYELNRQSVEVMKTALSQLSSKGIPKLEKMLTYGLVTIFSNREYSITIEVQERGDVKTAEIWLTETLSDGRLRKCKLRSAVGGGVQVITSLLLRIYFIMVLNLRRVIYMDETFTEIADEYLPALFDFIKKTVDDLGFKFMLITHDSRFIPYANKIYRMYKGEATQLER